MAASACTSAGASMSRVGASYAQHDGASTSRAGSSSPNIIVLDTDEEESDGFLDTDEEESDGFDWLNFVQIL